LKNENSIKAVEMMRKIRDQIAQEETKLSWQERQDKRRQELQQDPLWERFKHRLIPQPPSKIFSTR
jgi:hypothetical protein